MASESVSSKFEASKTQRILQFSFAECFWMLANGVYKFRDNPMKDVSLFISPRDLKVRLLSWVTRICWFDTNKGWQAFVMNVISAHSQRPDRDKTRCLDGKNEITSMEGSIASYPASEIHCQRNIQLASLQAILITKQQYRAKEWKW